jgi:hypothetical protein
MSSRRLVHVLPDNFDVCREHARRVPARIGHCRLERSRVMPRACALDERHAREAPEADHPDAEPDDPDDREHTRDDPGNA